MLEILEQKNIKPYQNIIRQLQIPEWADMHLTELLEEQAVKGYILYAYEMEQVVIYAVADGGDLDNCDGLVRSVLYKALLRGLNKAVFKVQAADVQETLSKLGFVKNRQNRIENIMDVMENCKKCKENSRNT